MTTTGSNPGARCTDCVHQGHNGLGQRTCSFGPLPPWLSDHTSVVIVSDENSRRDYASYHRYHSASYLAEMCGCYSRRSLEATAAEDAAVEALRKHDQERYKTINPDYADLLSKTY